MDNQEIWCDVKGYEGLYKISNLGRVKSLGNDKSRREKILILHKDRTGYLQVHLCKNGKPKWYTVHRLVLMTFNPCTDMNELQVNHIDEDKTNNRLENLAWCTCKENINHGTHNARIAEKLRGKFNTKNSIPVAQLTLDGKYIRSYKSSHDAEREGGFANQNITACCQGKRNTHKGYRWMYLSEFMDKNCGIID